MQEGSFRCDANVSVRKIGDTNLGTRTELKNINSFKFVEKAINYEIQRQIDLLEDGKNIIQETRLYDENKNSTKSMRSKEEANDYRYFPDPDLLPIEIEEKYIMEIKNALPELPEIKFEYYKSNYNFSEDQINIILSDIYITNFIDQAISLSKIEPKRVVNYFLSLIYSKLNKEKLKLNKSELKVEIFCLLLELIENKKITKNNFKNIIDSIWNKKNGIDEIIKSYTTGNEEDNDSIDGLIHKVISQNTKQVEEYKSGKTKIVGFFVGQVLKDAKGADPTSIKNKIIKILESV
jgi:aspartyl-tRNA(Asn)/glutamyl-tRNA(Gln) amidotransferase subunit B